MAVPALSNSLIAAARASPAMKTDVSMRSLLAGIGLLASLVPTLLLAPAAQAERKMFIIGADASGYGIDRCLVSGAPCGAAAAAAYCHTQNFAAAMSYRRVDRDDITGAIPAGGAGGCKGAACDDVVA